MQTEYIWYFMATYVHVQDEACVLCMNIQRERVRSLQGSKVTMSLTVPVVGELLKHGPRLACLHVDHHLLVLVLGVHFLKGVLQVLSMELLHNNRTRLQHRWSYCTTNDQK